MSEFKVNNIIIPEELPVIALKNVVLFPKAVVSVIIQRPKSVEALDFALTHSRLVLFVTQKNMGDNISESDLYAVGTIGRIVSVFKLPDGSSKIDIEGIIRAQINIFSTQEPFFRVMAQPLLLISHDSPQEKALLRRTIEQFRLVSEGRSFPAMLPEFMYMLSQLKDTEHLLSIMTANLNLDIDDQQKILELESVGDILRQLNIYLT